jgi:hypothetical protein
MLLTLIAIILFTTFGQAFNSQCNNKDIFRYDSRGKQRAKEMLHSDQGNFYTNPLKSETNNSSAFEQLFAPIPHDGPAHFKQLSVPTTTAFTGLQSILNDVTEISIWHQAFDNTLSRHPIMNVSNITSVPTLNALLTLSYLHPASGMTAHIDATPTSLLLLHIKDFPVITATTHDPSLLLPLCQDNSAIMTTTHANLLLLSVRDNSAIMLATHAICLLQLIVESFSTGAKQVAPVTIHNNLFNLIVALVSEGAHFAPYILKTLSLTQTN